MIILFDERHDPASPEAAYIEYLRAKYRRKIRRGETVDLDVLAREIQSTKEQMK